MRKCFNCGTTEHTATNRFQPKKVADIPTMNSEQIKYGKFSPAIQCKNAFRNNPRWFVAGDRVGFNSQNRDSASEITNLKERIDEREYQFTCKA